MKFSARCSLNVIVQLAINAAELRIICRGLEPYIAKLTNTTAFIVSCVGSRGEGVVVGISS
jgi:hypothetical protein